MGNKFDTESGKELIDELLNLYYSCEEQCRRIEQIIETLNKQQ